MKTAAPREEEGRRRSVSHRPGRSRGGFCLRCPREEEGASQVPWPREEEGPRIGVQAIWPGKKVRQLRGGGEEPPLNPWPREEEGPRIRFEAHAHRRTPKSVRRSQGGGGDRRFASGPREEERAVQVLWKRRASGVGAAIPGRRWDHRVASGPREESGPRKKLTSRRRPHGPDG